MVSFYKEKEDFFVWSGFCVMLKIYIENKAAVVKFWNNPSGLSKW